MAASWKGGKSEVLSGHNAADLRAFLRASSGRSDVLYLAFHQDAAGRVDLPSGERLAWSAFWPGEGMEHCVMVVDACHAAVAWGDPAIAAHPPRLFIATAEGTERTWELPLFSPRVSRFASSRPEVLARLRGVLGPGWEGKLSFWGLGWAITENGPPPGTREAWIQRMVSAQVAAGQVESRRGLKFHSTFSAHARDR
jgi:hypothetical protein